MSRSTRKGSSVKIKRAVMEKALMFSLSRFEVGFLFFGEADVITNVRRIRNTEANKEDYFEWDHEQRALEIKIARKLGLRLLGEGHSHPKPTHEPKLSLNDVRYFDKNLPHLLVHQGKVTAWCLESATRIEVVIR